MTGRCLMLVQATCSHMDHHVHCLPKERVSCASISWEEAIRVASWSRVKEEVLLGGLATDLTQRLFRQVMWPDRTSQLGYWAVSMEEAGEGVQAQLQSQRREVQT